MAYGPTVRDVSAPITLTVVGIPASQGSKVQMPNGVMLDGTSTKARAALRDWRKAVADEARRWLAEHPQPPISEPVDLTVSFRFAPVASDPYRTLHATYPDASKVLRATEDALTASGLLKDDRIISDLRVSKRYCMDGEAAGCTIRVLRLGSYESGWRAIKKRAAAEARKAARAS